MELVRAGDAAAFETIYDRYSRGLVSFCRHLLGSLEEAEDAVQHTFLAAHRSMLADDRELHLKAWLYAIARNKCISMLRVRRERLGLDDELELVPSTSGLSAEVEQREDLRALLGDLQRLPDDQRAALVLAELGAHNHDEIAEVLDVRREKVKALVFQAREALIAARTARETPCAEIREQLATARGGTLRRGNLRRHLEDCPGCRAFRMDVQRQRAAMAIVLPVVPSLALKEAVLGGTLAAAGAGAGIGGGGAAAGGLAAAGGAKAAAAKLMVVAAVTSGATGTGYVAVHKINHGRAIPPAVVAASPAALPAEATGKPVAVHLAETPSTASTPLPAHRRHSARKRAHRAKRHHHARHRAEAPQPPGPPAVEAAEPQPQTITPAAAPAPQHGRGKAKGHDKHAKKDKKDKHVQAAPAPAPADTEGDDDAEHDDQDQENGDDGDGRKIDSLSLSHPRGGPPGQLKKNGIQPLPPPGHRKDAAAPAPANMPPGQAKRASGGGDQPAG